MDDLTKKQCDYFRQKIASMDDDEDLVGFMKGHSFGFILGFLFAQMPTAVQRGFLGQLKVQFPEAFEEDSAEEPS